MYPEDAEGIANSSDPDQTVPLIWFYTVHPDLSVRKLRIITVTIVKLIFIHVIKLFSFRLHFIRIYQ